MHDILVNFIKNNSTLLTQLVVHSLILFAVIKLVNSVSAKIKERILADSNSNSKIHFLFITSRFIKITLGILIIASFLQANGYSLTSLMTGLGITGLAIGFAAKESLSCVLGSFAIMLDNIYKIGDYIEINGYAGIVEAINFHSTKLRAANNALITIPNNIPADTIVQNRSNAQYFRLIQNFGIEYDTSDDKINLAMSIIKQCCEQNNQFQKDYNVFISNLDDSAISLQLIANTTTNNWIKFLELKSELLQEIIFKFRENNINFAFPSNTVYLKNEN